MTSWPWMQGIEVAVADPIVPVCPEDDRPSVKALIEEHSEKIAKIKAALVDDPLYEPNKHDDLWIVRFWLSHKKSKKAIEAAKQTLAFRKEHNLDAKDMRKEAPHKVKDGKVREFLDCWGEDAVVFTQPDPKRGVIGFLRFESMHQHEIVEKLTEDYWLPGYLYFTEWCFQCIDYVTRTTGRLTKSIRIFDLKTISTSTWCPECSKRDGRAMGLMEDFYPQALATIFVINPPFIVGTLWNIARVLMPKRVVSKFDFINPEDNEKHLLMLHPHISEQNLPDTHGGKNPVAPKDWIPAAALDSAAVSDAET